MRSHAADHNFQGGRAAPAGNGIRSIRTLCVHTAELGASQVTAPPTGPAKPAPAVCRRRGFFSCRVRGRAVPGEAVPGAGLGQLVTAGVVV
jgi:hypothetical protein